MEKPIENEPTNGGLLDDEDLDDIVEKSTSRVKVIKFSFLH